MAELTEDIRRAIGQCFVFGFHGHEVSDDIKTLITKYYLGNVILMKRNVRDIEQMHALARSLQQLAHDTGHERPLMIGTDQENGLVSAFSSPACGTQFPGAMALAASGSPELAQKVTFASASEMKMAGINWAYSPVADVNSDPRNPVIGVRSFGDDPTKVSDFVGAVSAGLTDAKVAPSAKHFPGHGNTHVDSHLSLPRIMSTKESLLETELPPFQNLAKNKVASIMTGHMALPLITGSDVPSSLSHDITTRLLREEMGFDGVIVTDCLEMEAVAEKYGAEGGAVMALEAGADIVMICHRIDRHIGALERTYGAVREGRIKLEDITAKVKRVAALKDRFAGTWTDVLSAPLNLDEWKRLKAANEALSKEAYAASIALLHNPQNTLPLPPKAGPIVLFTPVMQSINLAVDDAEGVLRDKAGNPRNTAGPSYTSFAAALTALSAHALHHVVYTPTTTLSPHTLQYLQDASAVIFATRNGFDVGLWQIECLSKVVAVVKEGAPEKRLVVVSTCAPYDVLGLSDTLDVPAAVLATMEFSAAALETAARVTLGEVVAGGTVPVKVA